MAGTQPTKIQQLRSLANQPSEQAAYAATLLNAKFGQEVVLAALQTLQKQSFPPARPALLNLYSYYTAHGETRDPSAFTRSAIMRALRPLVQPADVDFLVQATATYVFPPPTFKEEGAPLRSAALLALNEVDDNLARYHAVRLLANEHTDVMSGEPAVTAARLLGAQEEILPLYFYVMQDGARVVPEVVSECLSHLITLPEALIPGIQERFVNSKANLILVGLFDLLLNHRTGPHGSEFLRTFLRETQQLDVYQYLVSTIVASGRAALIAELVEVVHFEQRREKVAILYEAFTLLPPNPEMNKVLEQLQSRLSQKKSRK
ncbi:MAG: hypothetical protein U0350_40905 [Caldilineaceae bacterium]